MSVVPFLGNPCNTTTIKEDGNLVYRPEVATIRAAIMRTVAHYPHPVTIMWTFAPSDAIARDNIAAAAALMGRQVLIEGSTVYLSL